jgi:hypothetical protein
MTVTARFERPLRPDSIHVSSLGYLAAAIWCADLRGPPPPRSASVHRLVPRAARRAPVRPAAILPFARASAV